MIRLVPYWNVKQRITLLNEGIEEIRLVPYWNVKLEVEASDKLTAFD